jgi:hypothetical protein
MVYGPQARFPSPYEGCHLVSEASSSPSPPEEQCRIDCRMGN